MASRHLTKSRYIAGLQCPRRLWLVVHEPLPYKDPDPGSPADIGQEIGRKAHLLFPGGVLVSEEPWQHAEAVARTAALMNDVRVPAVFEAAFEYDGIRIRVDVVERRADGTWGLREVKSSSGLKDNYLDDIALQAYVMRGAGVAVASIELLHVNTAYVRGPDGICWTDFFTRIDVGDYIAGKLMDLPGHLPAGVGAVQQFMVQPRVRATVTFKSAAASLAGSSVTLDAGPGVVVDYAGSTGADVPILGIATMRRPTARSTGATITQIEAFLLSQPGVPPQLAEEVRLLGDLRTTLPVPVPPGASVRSVQVAGWPGVLLADPSNAAAAVVWEDGRGLLHAVVGILDSQDVLNVADQLG